MRITVHSLAVSGLLHLALAGASFAQTRDAAYASLSADGNTAFYVAGPIGMSEGWNVFRGDSDTPLNPTPIRPVSGASQFYASTRLNPDSLVATLDSASPADAFLRLRLDQTTGNLYSIADADVARALGRLWIDSSGVGIGTYRIEVVDGSGTASGRNYTVTVRPSSMTAPTSPATTYADGRITLSWQYPAGSIDEGDPVTSFRIYEETDAGTEAIPSGRTFRQVGITDYKDILSAGPRLGERRFRITALDFAGNESRPSDPVSVTVVDDIPPEPVSQIESRPLSSRRVEIAWAHSGADVQGFQLFRSPQLTGPYRQIANTGPTVSAFSDTTVVPGTVYHYRVSAVDAAGNASRQSLTASVLVRDFEAPDAPTNLSARMTNGSVALNWAGSMPPDFNTYVILRRNITHADKQPWASANPSRVATTGYVDAGPTGLGFEEGAFYEFGVAAADSAANVSDTATVVIQIPDTTPPEPPVLILHSDASSVTVSWNPSGAGDLGGYRLDKRRLGETTDTEKTRDDTSTEYNRTVSTYTDRDVTTGTSYIYSLTAVDTLGNVSTASIDTIAVRRAGQPESVRNVRAALGTDGIELRWSEGSESSEKSFRIYRTNDAGSFAVLATVQDSAMYTDVSGDATDRYYVTRIWPDGRESSRSPVAAAK